MKTLAIAALASLLGLGLASSSVLAAQKKAVTGAIKPKIKTGAVGLTSWDCKAVGGTVVTVGDDRCGASRRYCRMPDTNAVCIEEKLQ